LSTEPPLQLDMNKARAPPPTAPARGSFPLDHEGACKVKAGEFLACIKQAAGAHVSCRELSKEYLACRMDKGLMAAEDLDTLGFSEASKPTGVPPPEGVDALPPPREIIAGLSASKKRPGFLFGLGGSGEGKRGGGH
jgi:cytochrome c oxidase assembly protein subunit 19